ncbi:MULTISPECIES: type II toxin-antitoxin system RelB/DinJ family antitoxin [unclassified Facklamia]|nr:MULTISPECIES: type II toxin-antitoxin system RelB/DinJ family antitoxin [unclassified Facklamia]
MARTSNIYVRIEPNIKEQAEAVLEKLGIPMSNAVSIFFKTGCNAKCFAF